MTLNLFTREMFDEAFIYAHQTKASPSVINALTSYMTHYLHSQLEDIPSDVHELTSEHIGNLLADKYFRPEVSQLC